MEWSPEARVTADKVNSALGIADWKIVVGQNIGGIWGNQHPYRVINGYATSTSSSAPFRDMNNATLYYPSVTIPTGFMPLMIVLHVTNGSIGDSIFDFWHYLLYATNGLRAALMPNDLTAQTNTERIVAPVLQWSTKYTYSIAGYA